MKKGLLGILLRRSGAHVKAAGETVEVKPLTVTQSYVIERVFGPVADAIVEAGTVDHVVLAQHGHELVTVVAEAISKPVEWVNNLPREDFNRLLDRILEIEQDFFNAQIVLAAARRAKTQQTGR